MRIGGWLRMDFRTKLQFDFHDTNPDVDGAGVFEFRRRRVGIEGRLFQDFEYELEYEIGREGEEAWRDAFVNWRRMRNVQVRAGKFKIPFGRDQLTPPAQLDFVNRSLIGRNLAPGRDAGAV
ncbi:MAG: porin, partial [Bryobacteraceae bacterium]